MYKVLQINSVGNYGSTGKIANHIGDLCLSKGWESHIAVGRKVKESKSNIIRIGDDFDLKLHGLKTRIMDRHGFGSTKATVHFISEIEKIKPSIIHLHNLHGYYINIEVLFEYLSKSKIPVIWTLHDCWTFTGHCAYFDFANCDKWKIECSSCPQKKDYPTSFVVDNSKRNYRDKKRIFNSVENLTMVPVSNWLGKLLEDSFMKKYSYQVINNGIDLNEFYSLVDNEKVRSDLSLGNKFVILGVASIWSKRKGLADFIKLSEIIDENSIIILVGLDKKQLNLLPNNIIGIERTDSVKELSEIYAMSDIYLNLTYEDNFPTTNIEALACGTPVLTYNSGGSIEAVSESTGYILEKGDIKGILDVINDVRIKGKEHFKMSCRKRAETLYCKEERYNDYISLYEKILRTIKS